MFLLHHFCVDFAVSLESLSCWTIYLWPSLCFLAEATRFSTMMFWYFVELIVPLILNSSPGPLAEKHLQNTNDPLLYLTVGMRCFSLYAFHFAAKHVNGVYGQNVQFWSHLTIARCLILFIVISKFVPPF